MTDPRLIAAACAAVGLVSLAPVGAAGQVVLSIVFPLAAAGVIATAIRRQAGPSVVGWLLLGYFGLRALGAASWWAAGGLGDQGSETPAVSDVLYVASHVVLAAALCAKLARAEDRRLLALDLSVIAVASALVLVAAMLGPALAATSDLPDGVRALHMAYVAADVLVVAVWLRMLLTPRPRPRSFDLLVAGTAVFVGGHVLGDHLSLGGGHGASAWLGAAGNVQALLFAIAATRRKTEPADARTGDFELHIGPAIMLGAALLTGPALALYDVIGDVTSDHTAVDVPVVRAFTAVGSALVAFLVSARIVVLLRRSQGMSVALRDALARSDASLLASQTRLRSLVENIPAVTFIADAATGRSLYVSPQIERLVGHKPDEWVGGAELLQWLYHPEDRDEQLRRLAMALNLGSGVHSTELRMVRADGEVIWVRQDIVVTREHDRTVILGFWLDITEAKTAQQERDSMELELRLAQRLEAVGELAAGVAHEINTPIQFVGDTARFLDDAWRDVTEVLNAYADAVAGSDVPPGAEDRLNEALDVADLDYLRERVPAAFERTFHGIERVATIVQALRSFAHPPSGAKAPADLNAALRNTLVVARSEYRYVAEVEEQLGDLPLVNAHVGDLGQAFLNLVVNAAHAIEDARSEGDELGRITVSTRVDGEHVVVSIADTGPGIPPEVAERVFDPFFTTKEVGRGTGQGLSITRTIVVDRHNGSLTFETGAGGTTFHVRLPITGEAAPDAPALQEAA